MPSLESYFLEPIGTVRSSIVDLVSAPKQSFEGGAEATLVLGEKFRTGLRSLSPGDDIIVITWLDRARRDVLEVHPRGDQRRPLEGVFSTRSPHRPNPLGLHRVKIIAIEGLTIRVGPLEALDGTPVVDIKPVLPESHDS
jgi:tRNA-Thr(GGU) m(6)t(6)A37 methyltransferase TsaA